MQITASCSIQSATTGFTAYIFPYRSRVSLKRRSKGLSRMTTKVSRPVLRGPGPRNGAWLLGDGMWTGVNAEPSEAIESQNADFCCGVSGP